MTSLAESANSLQRDWSSYFAPGAEIRQYIEDVAEKYKVMRYVKLSHEIVGGTYLRPPGFELRLSALRRPWRQLPSLIP